MLQPYAYPDVPNATVGALLLGLAVSCVVYGVTCAQTTLFYRLYPAERWYLKSTIFLLWTIETANVLVTTHAVYHYAIMNVGNYSEQYKIVWSLWFSPATNSLTGLIVQMYYSRRLYIISSNKVVVFMICSLSVINLVIGWFRALVGVLSPEKLPRYNDITVTIFAVTAFTDILVTASLAYYLQIRKTGLTRTHSLVNAIILHVVGCGTLCSVLSFVSLVTYITMGRAWVAFEFCFVLGKAYTNSMLSSLNARASYVPTAETHIPMNTNMAISDSK